MKKLILLVMIILFIPVLSGCGSDNTKITEWNYENELLNWNDVKNATYYEVDFYQTDLTSGEPTTPLKPMYTDGYVFYAYDSQLSFYGLPIDRYFNFKIKTFFKDGSSIESDMIKINHTVDYPYPIQLGIGQYVGKILSWTDMSQTRSDLVNYTVKINDQTQDVDTFTLDMNDYDPGIYKVQVKANYQDGSSKWTMPYYANINVDHEQIQTSYEHDSKTDLTYQLTDNKDIVAVAGRYYIFNTLAPLPEDIVKIDGSNITVNHYFINNNISNPNALNLVFMQIYLITNDEIYTLYIELV